MLNIIYNCFTNNLQTNKYNSTTTRSILSAIQLARGSCKQSRGGDSRGEQEREQVLFPWTSDKETTTEWRGKKWTKNGSGQPLFFDKFASTVYSDIPSACAACIVSIQYCNANALFSHFVLQFNTKKSWTHTFHNHASCFFYSLFFYLVLMIVKLWSEGMYL